MTAPPAAAVLVEGPSDEAALRVIARRLERSLDAEGVSVVVLDGITNISAAVATLTTRRPPPRLAGLYDAGEEHVVRRALHRSGYGELDRAGLAAAGFQVCDADLEDELIRSVGIEGVLAVVEAEGEGRAWRTMRRQPAQVGRPLAAQLRRFMGTRSMRKIRYGRLLAEAVELDRIPPPLVRVLQSV